MKVAIIGSGISGLTAAYLLNKKYDVSLFEAQGRLGGHTATINFNHHGADYAIDTGFIVYNDWTYPNFIKLMTEIGVASEETAMGFSVSCKQSGLEYSGGNLNTLFAQRSNLFKPSHWRMILDILRFNKEAINDLDNDQINADITLGDYLTENRYSRSFCNNYLVPMGSAIWSSSHDNIKDFSALFFIRFFKNHGLLSVKNRPQWRVIKGGSKEYIAPLTASFSDKIHLNIEITGIKRDGNKVHIDCRDAALHENTTQTFDQVIFACHSDQALKLLDDPSDEENRILSAIPYQMNDVVLHTDTSLLPKRRKAWASWNYQLGHADNRLPILSYNMNILQNLADQDTNNETFVVTLNATNQIDPNKVIGKFNYAHPVFTVAGQQAQQQWQQINGVNNTWFCGAYWRNGFHEDGCASAVRVAEGLGITW